MQIKICSKCGIEKELSEFYKNKTCRFGVQSICKLCNKKYQIENQEAIKKQQKIYRDSHKQEIREWRAKNILTIKERVKQYNEKHKEERKEYLRLNKESISKKAEEYRLKNREKINNQVLQRTLKRLKTDTKFRLRMYLRGRMWKVLNGNPKAERTLELLGCSVDFLKKHLESQFKDGMCWENHGNGWNNKREWQIDHIKPCASFDLSKPEEQLKCFHYSNLQPLWAKDNRIKGAN
jgi:hypothetical protein